MSCFKYNLYINLFKYTISKYIDIILSKSNKLLTFILYFIFLFVKYSKKDLTIKSDNIVNDNLLFNVRMISVESKEKKISIDTPLIKEIKLNNLTYILFPKGFFLKYYNNKKLISLIADWCIYSNINDLYNIRGNIKINNYNNDILLTSNIFWDNKNKIFFNSVPTKIYRSNGMFIYAKNGIKSSYDLREIILKNVNGVIFN